MDNNYHLYYSQQLNTHNKYNIFSRFYNKLYSKEKSGEAYFMPQSEKTNKTEKRKYTAGILTLFAGLVILSFTRGVQKNTSKYLGKFKDHLEAKRNTASISHANKRAKVYEYAIRNINYIIKKSESINNITSLKDVLFMRAMYKTKPTKKIHEFISRKFENLSRKTVTKSYKKTEERFNKMYKAFDELDEYLLKDSPDEIIHFKGKPYTKRELVNKAKDHRDTVKLLVGGFISKDSQEQRYKYMKRVTANLYSDFWDLSFKDFWTKDNKFKRKEMWQTFIAAENIKGDKTILHDNVSYARNALSYTDKDRTDVITDCLKQIKSLIPPKDEASFDVLEKLEWFGKNPELMRSNKEMFFKELAKLEHTFLDSPNLDNLGKAQQNSKNTCLKIIREMLNEDASGEIQDMLDIYYKIAPFELSKSDAIFSMNEAIKSFDKSVNLETVELFDKIRDLELGSAPTDILTIAFSGLMITKGLGFAKNEDERISIALKSGIPIAGAILTSLISTTKLVSGGKSLALGAVSGVLLNQIGLAADNMRKKKRLF